MALTSRTASATRAPNPAEPLDEPVERAPAPVAYTWTFELRRDNKEELELYFFFGDPDSRSTYVLTREQP